MISEEYFARFLRRNKNLIACTEVSFYGCIADVLAVDLRSEKIIEYEFKRNSHDLKIAEKKKSKYKIQKRAFRGCYGHIMPDGKYINKSLGVNKEPQKPHQFYFVVPLELYKKEKEYLKSLGKNIGVIAYYEGGDYYVEKRSAIRKTNLQKFEIAKTALLTRLCNVYAY